jgi:acetyl-CoA carboxylase biotin carboxylase subunit
VEHPVTELVTGLDLVQLQLHIAAGERLPFSQQDIALRGSAIECRICAEDPENNFFPSPGKIAQLREPMGPGIRVDSGVYPGWTVPLDYDPLLAKLIAWAPAREDAINRLERAIHEYSVVGVQTNLAFFREILIDAHFRSGDLHTGFIPELFARRKPAEAPPAELEIAAALAAELSAASQSKNGHERAANEHAEVSRWLSEGRGHLLR